MSILFAVDTKYEKDNLSWILKKLQFATSYLYRGECGGIREITESYNHCTAGAAEVNMAQILQGAAEEYSSHIHQCQAKASNYSIWARPDNMELPYCQVWLILSVLKVADNMGLNLKINWEDMTPGGV